ncbi:MAG: tetratricopeptide repeat protein [Actinomycetota bacterium]
MAALLVLYLVLVTQLAIRLILIDDLVSRVIGVALIVFPIIGLWALVAELVFGIRSQQLVTRLAATGELPVDNLPSRASGRPLRSVADAEFPKYKAEVEADPDSWKAWFRLGLAYDASGDRRRARGAIRHSIALERKNTQSP